MIGIYQQEQLDLSDLANSVLIKYLDRRTKDAGFFKLPSQCYNPLRQQYDADSILAALAAKNKGQYDYKIGIVDVDLYSHGMNFIFGLADPLRKTAIVSTYRLEGEKRDERVSKELVHETGHLLGLQHCSNPKCVMYFSNTVVDTDNKEVTLCKKCRSKIG